MLSVSDGTLVGAVSSTYAGGGKNGICSRIDLNRAETGKNLTIGRFAGYALKRCRGHAGRKCGRNDVSVMETVQELKNPAAGLDDSSYRSSAWLEAWISGPFDPCISVKTVIK